ncbi:MAG: hypothetical protein OXJ53_16920 [Gammaproteobacteria bacterium]|nr:hypothetical protein [Gammaproteobacteria bacterium]MDE0271031.1 hypothetical protein [Gammaproteobacteria bacterium]
MPDIINPNYVDQGELREQDQVPLSEYLAQSDRSDPSWQRGMPFFSGREAEISAFRRTVNGIALGRKANATMAVEGPPGAGKSALLCQFLEEMRELPPIGEPPRRWLPVFMDGASALCPDEIMLFVDKALSRRLAKDVLDSHLNQEQAKSKALINFLGGQHRIDAAKSLAREVLDRGGTAFGFGLQAKDQTPPASLAHVAGLRERVWSKWQIMLMIDEAQGITMHTPGAHPGTLSSIHQGTTPLNLTFCAFGLPGTLSALAKAGVSRTSEDRSIALRGLDGPNSTVVIERCFARYGVMDAEPWQAAILERSANWPQHLSAYLTKALAVMQAHAGIDEDLGAPPEDRLAEAIEAGDRSRSKYYNMRIQRLIQGSGSHMKCAKRIIPMLREANGDLPEDEINEALTSPPLGLNQDQAQAFLEAARHSGLLAPGDHATLRLAIPSFAGYILDEEPPPVGELAGGLEP